MTSFDPPKGCIIGRDEIFLHCATVRKEGRKKDKNDGNPRSKRQLKNQADEKGSRDSESVSEWSEWKATESVCNAENQYKDRVSLSNKKLLSETTVIRRSSGL